MSVQPIPPCRHRGEHVEANLWKCTSPKLVIPQQIVTSEFCCHKCPYVDHTDDVRFSHVDPKPHLSPAVHEDRATADGRIQVRPAADDFAIAMITAPRSNPTVRRSLGELRGAGFRQPIHLFAEPGSDVADLPARVELHRNRERLGAWRNWRQAAARLLELSKAPYLVVCEDDIRLTPDASLALQFGFETLDLARVGYLSLYTPWQNVLGASLRQGWQPLKLGPRARGALAYGFTRETLANLLRKTPCDEPSGQVHADIAVTVALEESGRECYFHIPSLCDHTASDASTLDHPAHAMIAGFEFQPRRRVYRADLSTQLPGRLAIVTAYFNPSRCPYRLKNYHEFSRHVAESGSELWTVEVAYDQQAFQLDPGPQILQLRSPDMLWQKEQALNVLIEQLPAEYDKVAWIDADVIFETPDWPRRVGGALGTYPFVQCFSEATWLDESGQPEATKRAVTVQPSTWVCGLAWAARRCLLDRYGLFATDVSGCGDGLCYIAVSGQMGHALLDSYPGSMHESLCLWHQQLWADVQGEVGTVEGTVRHLYHGKLADRRYLQRIELLDELDFQPDRDLVIRENGLLGWSGRSPRLEDEFRRFFMGKTEPAPGESADAAVSPRTVTDPLRRAEMTLPVKPLKTEYCIATVVTPEWAEWLHGFLASLDANGDCDDALKVVFLVGESSACESHARNHGATVIKCRLLQQAGPAIKSILYSVALVVDAQAYLCLDVDTRIQREIRSVFTTLSVCRSDTVLVARDGLVFRDLGEALEALYQGNLDELRKLWPESWQRIAEYPLVVNDGVFAACRSTLLDLDRTLRELPDAVPWLEQTGGMSIRNQFLFNAYLAIRNCAVELDCRFNAQYTDSRTKIVELADRVQVTIERAPVHIFHVTTSAGKENLLRWEKAFLGQSLPTLPRGRDGYAEFLAAVRQWFQVEGQRGLDGTFYGNRYNVGPRIRDPGTCSLWGTLFHLVRSQGCTKILETGTSRGIGTGCLASAVVDRPNAKVVSIDGSPHPDRHAFWRLLPRDTASVIETCQFDSLKEWAATRNQREQFHAALLDRTDSAEFVLREFELAQRLVAPGGLILVHDIHPAFFDVWKAVDEIQSRGYGVVRLWCAEQGVQTDDRLGLAVIENRRQTTAAGTESTP